jgi:hypothetical protein
MVTTVPGLVIWIGVTARIVVKKAKLCRLVLICCLMIVFEIALIVILQIQYTYFLKVYEGQEINIEFYNQLFNASEFLNITAFNLAHWLFAFNYWALSYRVELTKNVCLPTSTTAG